MNNKKRCTKCKRLLPLTLFHKHKPSNDGRKSRCKGCRCELQRQHNRKYPEEKKERDKQYYQNNKDKISVHAKQYRLEHQKEKRITDARYRAENSEELKDWHRKHYQKNRNKKLNQCKEYASKNKEKISQYQKGYREKNVNKLKEYARQVRKTNPERCKVYASNYLSRKKCAEGEYTLNQWGELLSFFDDICPCCKERVKSFEIDHIIPLTWNNTSNWIINIQPLCKSCNCSKNNYHSTDYRPIHVKNWAENQMRFNNAS